MTLEISFPGSSSLHWQNLFVEQRFCEMPFLSLDLNSRSTEMGPWTGPTSRHEMLCWQCLFIVSVASFPLDFAFLVPSFLVVSYQKCSTAVLESTAEMITNTAGFQNRCVGVCTRVCVCACVRTWVCTYTHASDLRH